MESKSEYFCHTCKKLCIKVSINGDEEVTCTECGEFFVELIEDKNHLLSLQDIYKSELKEEQFFDCQSDIPP